MGILAVPSRFETTRWSVVVAAGEQQSAVSREALGALFETYWKPLYVFLRRRGHSEADAQDLVQEFFTRFLEKNYIKDVHRGRGRFRSFLLASLKHFLADEWGKSQRQKRGGGTTHVSFEAASTQGLEHLLKSNDKPADVLFDRQWALSVLDEALKHLESKYRDLGKEDLFAALKGQLTVDGADAPYRELGEGLSMSEDAVKMAVHRLRAAYRKAFRKAVEETVGSKADAKDEMNHLLHALRS